MFDKFVKSHCRRRDGLWKKLDILGVVSETAIRQYMWYGQSPFQIYNDVDRAFYESIKVGKCGRRVMEKPMLRCRRPGVNNRATERDFTNVSGL